MTKKLALIPLLVCFCINGFSQLNAEQKAIKQVFIDFQHYYLKNEKKFDAFHLYKGKGKENGPPFHIQWKEVEKYFSFLRKNVPYVGEAYIKNERRDFEYSDSCFKADPTDEMAAGFDYDRWGGGQDAPLYMVKYNTSNKNIYQVGINGNKAELKIGMPLWEGSTEKDRFWNMVPFVKENGTWKMAANISGVEEPEKKDPQ
jgi:hypothetical protein